MVGLAMVLGALGALLVGLAALITSIGVYYRLSSSTPGAPQLPGLPREPLVADIPDGLQEWINEESEPWARQELERRALAEYRASKDWAVVEVELKRSLTELGQTPHA